MYAPCHNSHSLQNRNHEQMTAKRTVPGTELRSTWTSEPVRAQRHSLILVCHSGSHKWCHSSGALDGHNCEIRPLKGKHSECLLSTATFCLWREFCSWRSRNRKSQLLSSDFTCHSCPSITHPLHMSTSFGSGTMLGVEKMKMNKQWSLNFIGGRIDK